MSGWEDRDFRKRHAAAARGFRHLAGSDQDKEFVLSMNPSMAALAACQNIPDQMAWDFTKGLKKEQKFPTVAQVEEFCQRNLLPEQKLAKQQAAAERRQNAERVPQERLQEQADTEVTPVSPEATPEPVVSAEPESPMINVTPTVVETEPVAEEIETVSEDESDDLESFAKRIVSDIHTLRGFIQKDKQTQAELKQVLQSIDNAAGLLTGRKTSAVNHFNNSTPPWNN